MWTLFEHSDDILFEYLFFRRGEYFELSDRAIFLNDKSHNDAGIHVLKQIPANFDIEQFEAKAMNSRGLISQIPPRYRTTYFAHTMGGGYTAGYYSYIWAEVLDCDAFEAFKETGDIFNQNIASKFRSCILTPGCIEDADVMYKNFRGKAANIDPLLRNRGLK